MDKPNVDEHTFAEDIFDRCDMDNNGALSKDELINVLVRLDSKTWTRQKVEALLSEMDRDGNGHIDYGEFEKFISSKTRKDKYARNALIATFQNTLFASEPIAAPRSAYQDSPTKKTNNATKRSDFCMRAGQIRDAPFVSYRIESQLLHCEVDSVGL